MRSTQLTAALVVAALAAGGCGTRTSGRMDPVDATPLPQPTTSTSPAPERNGATTTVVASAPETTATTTTSPTMAGSAPGPGEMDALLAEIDAQLAGLDLLMNQAAAALAAQEGEIP